MTAATRRIRVGAYHDWRSGTEVTTRRSANLARGMMISTMNKTMKGSPAESPPNQEMVAAYLVARASTTPMSRPPTNTRGRLEK